MALIFDSRSGQRPKSDAEVERCYEVMTGVTKGTRQSGNPLNWKRTECDISISGLGATRRFKSGHVIMTQSARYVDQPAHERADIRRSGQQVGAVSSAVAEEL